MSLCDCDSETVVPSYSFGLLRKILDQLASENLRLITFKSVISYKWIIFAISISPSLSCLFHELKRLPLSRQNRAKMAIDKLLHGITFNTWQLCLGREIGQGAWPSLVHGGPIWASTMSWPLRKEACFILILSVWSPTENKCQQNPCKKNDLEREILC